MKLDDLKQVFNEKLIGWFPVVADDDKTYVNNVLTYTNILRLRLIAWMLLIFMTVLICIHLIYIDKVQLESVIKIAPHIMALRIIFIGVAAIFLVVTGKLSFPGSITRNHQLYESAFLMFNLIGFAILSGLTQSLGPGITSAYLIAVLVSATFLYLDWKKSILIYTTAWTVLTVMIWTFQPDWIVAFSGFLNGTFITILAISISRIIYANQVQDFISKRLIEKQKENLASTNKILERMSYLDGLTNITNRRFFDEFLARELRRAARESFSISLVMLDIDKFKQYNDTFGHQAGDNVLVQVAEVLSKSIKRPGDIAARYGGEEFAIVLTNTDLEGANCVAESVRKSIENLNIENPHSPTNKLTVSCGLACMQPNNDQESPTIIIASADKALYEAKKAGGNKCIWAKSQNGRRILVNVK